MQRIISRRVSSSNLGTWLGAAADMLYLWYERASTRRQLHTLDEHMLKDIGLSRADAQREAHLPFWR